MTPEELLKQGKLDECLKAVESKVRSAPADPKLRVMLFQVLAVMGQWDRAQTQLQTSAQMNPGNMLMAQVCKQAILCEFLRQEVWSGKRSPLVLGEPEEWVSWVIQAAKLSAQGQHDAAAELRARAFDAAPAVAGSIVAGEEGGAPVPFEWIADADERLGPMLEAIVDGKYYWIPWQRIALVKIDRPTDLRDTVWLPANFIWSAGGSSVGLIPVRYPGSENAANDPLLRMARKTEFVEQGGMQVPLGQRLLATNEAEYPLLEVRSVRVGDAPLNPEAVAEMASTAAMSLESALRPGGSGGSGGVNG